MAAKKKTFEIKQTESDAREEQEAIDKRRSTPRRKSAWGPRDDRLTVLIPKPLHREVALYAKGSGQSIGDIVNRYLEEIVSTDEAKERIKAARAFYGAMDEKGDE